MTCAHCGAMFERVGVARYCSSSCRYATRTRPIRDRFWEKVDDSGGDEACWPWTGNCLPFGHGYLREGHSGMRYAHRLAWEMANGAIPQGLSICHHCDNPSCVNPQHLFSGSQAENLRDMRGKGRGFQVQSRYRSENATAKLNEDQVALIRDAYKEGVTQVQLAAIYGVNQSTISIIALRKGWKHV